MRPRRREGQVPAALLAPPTEWVDIPSAPASVRAKSYAAWLQGVLEWRRARSDWADERGWPGGMEAMFEGEPEIPDGPFDPDSV